MLLKFQAVEVGTAYSRNDKKPCSLSTNTPKIVAYSYIFLCN